MIQPDFIPVEMPVNKIPSGAECIRCWVSVDDSSFRDKHEINNYFQYGFCAECQEILIDNMK